MSSTGRSKGRQGKRERSLRVVGDPSPDAQLTVHIGERLRHLRLRQGLTQEQAAGAAGITRNALMGLERQRFPNPYLSTLLSLMRCYGLSSLDELLGRSSADAVYDAWEAAGWANTRRAGNDS